MVAAIPGGERVLFASEGGLIEVDMQSHEVFRRLPNVQTWTVSTSEDGADISVVADDGTTHVFSDGPERVLTTGTASAAALSPDGSLLYVKYAGTVQKWSFTGGTRLLDRTLRATDSRLQGDSWMRLSPNSDLVAMTADTMTADVKTAVTRVAVFDVSTGDFIVNKAVGGGQEQGMFPGSWHASGKSFVSGLIDGSLARFTLKGQVLRRRVCDLPIWAVEQLADGEHIAVAASPDSADVETAKRSEVFLVDATTLEPVGEPISLEGRQVTSMTVSPDSQTAFLLTSRIPEASTSFNFPDEWAILDLGRGVEVQRGPLPDLDFGAWEFARFSPDGRHIMAGAGRGLALFDLESRSFDGLPRTGHASFATTGSFSPDGSRMVTGGTTGDVALWDTASGELLDRVKLPSDQGWPYPGFSSDGLRVIIPTDGDIFTWNPLSDTLVSAACRMAGRSMTRYEWFEQLGGAIQYHATCPEQDAAAAAETAAGRG